MQPYNLTISGWISSRLINGRQAHKHKNGGLTERVFADRTLLLLLSCCCGMAFTDTKRPPKGMFGMNLMWHDVVILFCLIVPIHKKDHKSNVEITKVLICSQQEV